MADPSKIAAWAQFRCDALTDLVNELCTVVHAQGKKVGADVYPGPMGEAKQMVRQEWEKWNVDAVYPLNYNDFYAELPSWIGLATREEAHIIDIRCSVFCLLPSCRWWP